MYSVPYGSAQFTIVTGVRFRPDYFQIRQCDITGWFSAYHTRTNKCFPLDDRTDIDGDIINRVIDGDNYSAN